MIDRLAATRVTIRLAHILFIAVIALAAFVAGMATRPWGGSAAPGDISACVHNYTGAVRMSPYGATNCNVNETKVGWAGQETLPTFLIRSRILMLEPGSTSITNIGCETGEVATGGGVDVPTGWTIYRSTPSTTFPPPLPVPTGWASAVHNTTAVAGSYELRVVCASQAT